MRIDCIEWQNAKNALGYGVTRYGGKSKLAHRVAWEKIHGEIPPGMCICHKCDNPSCVNVDHLYQGTRKDNNRDCMRKGRRPPPAGERNSGVKISEETARHIKSLRGLLPQRAIGRMFGLGDSQMSRIMRGQSWKYIGE